MTLKFPAFQKWTTTYIEKIWSPKLEDLSSNVIPYALETVVLARQYGLDTVLKRALYELVRAPGFHPVSPVADENEHNPGATLSLLDFQLLLEAREHLTNAWFYVAKFTSHRGDSRQKVKCPLDATLNAKDGALYYPCIYMTHNISHAKHVHARIVDLQVFPPMLQKWMYDPVLGICEIMNTLENVWDKGEKDECCEDCRDWFQQRYLDLQKQLWNDLDRWLKL